MRLQIASDLHFEFYKNNLKVTDFITPSADYLALLGDIGYPEQKNYLDFIEQCSKIFKLVFLITGNHEYYATNKNRNMEDVDKKIETLVSKFDNVVFLNNKSYQLDENTTILGTTLWSYIPKKEHQIVEYILNDYNNIYHDGEIIKASQTTTNHVKNVDWLVDEIKKNKDKNVIVLTHHTPSYKSIAPQYKGLPGNCAFASRLDYIFEQYPNIKGWLFGHTHASVEFKLGNAICGSNPVGYKRNDGYENKFYKKDKVYEF